MGQERSLQAFPAACGPAEQHPRGEGGVGAVVGLDVGQSWKRGCEGGECEPQREGTAGSVWAPSSAELFSGTAPRAPSRVRRAGRSRDRVRLQAWHRGGRGR